MERITDKGTDDRGGDVYGTAYQRRTVKQLKSFNDNSKDLHKKSKEDNDLTIEVNMLSDEIQCLKEERARAKDEVQELTKQLEKANDKIKCLKEELTEVTLWVQRHPRDSEHDNQKVVTRIANIHINLLQGLIRTKFLQDAAAKCRKLKEGLPEENVEEVKKKLQSG